MSPQDRLTITEVSNLIGVSINTLQRKAWRKKAGIPLIKIGRNLISFRSLIEKWIEDKWRKSAA